MSARKIDFVRKYDKSTGRWMKQLYSGGPVIIPEKFNDVKTPKLIVQGVSGSGHPSPSYKQIENIVSRETTKRMDDVGDSILSGLRKRSSVQGSGVDSIRKRIEGLVMGSGLQVM